MNTSNPNKLITEKSPYLLQHAYNPVDWYPWGEEAFEKARTEDKPVFLSIGYSTCHWCHVMEEESFEDNEVAALINETFVCIKVDREERPDIDSVYMAVCQGMTGGGGWPLTIVMTPEKLPFFAGTYFPRESKHNRPGMMELIPRIAELWKDSRQEIEKSAHDIAEWVRMESLKSETHQDPITPDILHTGYQQLKERFDAAHGGFGTAPKFPTPHNYYFLLRYYLRTKEKPALEMTEQSLNAMRTGGIFDQAGFGFHRYSTDKQWLLPHFEKMLYDQATLLYAYTELFAVTGKLSHKQTAYEIIEYVLRDLSHYQGGFYSAEDADSEGEEGKFYLWTESEIREKFSDKADALIRIFNIQGEGNFFDPFKGGKTGENILHMIGSFEDLAEAIQRPVEEIRITIQAFADELREERSKRIRPHLDDKILTDWNGLMIAALARAAAVFNDREILKPVEKAFAFLMEKMETDSGKLLHRYRDEEAAVGGFLEDYAFLAWGALELFSATLDSKYLEKARRWGDILISDFADPDGGGFYFTPVDGEALLSRQKDVYDGAIPSGNSVAIMVLQRLGNIFYDTTYSEIAEKAIRHFYPKVLAAPSAYTFFLCAVDQQLTPSSQIVIAGDLEKPATTALYSTAKSIYLPHAQVFLIQPDKDDPLVRLLPHLGVYKEVDGKPAAYVCSDYSCQAPAITPEELKTLLGAGEV